MTTMPGYHYIPEPSYGRCHDDILGVSDFSKPDYREIHYLSQQSAVSPVARRK